MTGLEAAKKEAILVMDDDEMIREISGIALRRAGYEVAFAEDGAAAVARYQRSLEDGTRFVAVILDVNIPGRMGGREALARLLELDPQVKAFVSSGCPDDPAMVDHRALGFAGVIEKPDFYLKKALPDLLRELLS